MEAGAVAYLSKCAVLGIARSMSQTQPSAAQSPTAPSRPRRPVLRFLKKRLQGWRLRHQLPFNFWIHLLGIPLALSGLVLFFFDWRWGLVTFVSGYLLQWIGHLAEGNDLGEWAAVKRLLGLPYVGIAPRWNPDDPSRL
jgi:hypothetical protein